VVESDTAKNGMEPLDEAAVRRWTHQQTFLWLAEHPGYLAGFEGEWVAMVGPKIVGHSAKIGEAIARSREAGFDDPLLVPVLLPGEYIF
jgi:hypothetical protein